MEKSNETIGEFTRPYGKVLIILFNLTVIEIIVGSLEQITDSDWSAQEPIIIALLLSLALLKAFFVAAFFMGIKYEEHPLIITVITFATPLFIGLPIAFLSGMGGH
ncbi:MAG: cytochrome C oxidase subunit IV family protein [Promethearchaeota archaeon]